MAIPTGATRVRLKTAPQRGQVLAFAEIIAPHARHELIMDMTLPRRRGVERHGCCLFSLGPLLAGAVVAFASEPESIVVTAPLASEPLPRELPSFVDPFDEVSPPAAVGRDSPGIAWLLPLLCASAREGSNASMIAPRDLACIAPLRIYPRRRPSQAPSHPITNASVAGLIRGRPENPFCFSNRTTKTPPSLRQQDAWREKGNAIRSRIHERWPF